MSQPPAFTFILPCIHLYTGSAEWFAEEFVNTTVHALPIRLIVHIRCNCMYNNIIRMQHMQ
eukprot:17421-Heterococcus_DN1.PRE.3